MKVNQLIEFVTQLYEDGKTEPDDTLIERALAEAQTGNRTAIAYLRYYEPRVVAPPEYVWIDTAQ